MSELYNRVFSEIRALHLACVPTSRLALIVSPADYDALRYELSSQYTTHLLPDAIRILGMLVIPREEAVL